MFRRTIQASSVITLALLALGCSGAADVLAPAGPGPGDPGDTGGGSEVLGAVAVGVSVVGCDPVESIDLDIAGLEATAADGTVHPVDSEPSVSVTCSDSSATITADDAGLPVGDYVSVVVHLDGAVVHLSDGSTVESGPISFGARKDFTVDEQGTATVEIPVRPAVVLVGGRRVATLTAG